MNNETKENIKHNITKFTKNIALVLVIAIFLGNFGLKTNANTFVNDKLSSNKKGIIMTQKDNIKEGRTPYKDERVEIQQYMYVISLCLQGGSVGEMIAICDEMAKNYPEYFHWCQIQKGLAYNKYAYLFGKDIEVIYADMLEIFEKESPYFENQDGFETIKLIVVQAYNELKQYQKAIDLLNSIEYLVKNDISFNYTYYSERSRAKALLGDYKGALDDLNKINVKEETYLLDQEDYIVRKQVLEKLLAGDKNVVYPVPTHNRDSIMGIYLMSKVSKTYQITESGKLESSTSNFDFEYPEIVMPKSSVGLEIKGLEYASQGKYKEAEECFAKAIEKAPNELSTYYSRALMYQKKKMYKEALKDLDIYLKTPSSKGYKLRAEIKYEMKDYKGAMVDFKLYHNLYSPYIKFSKKALYAEYPKLKGVK